MDTHTSVYITSTSFVPAFTSSVRVILPPVCAAMASHSATSSFAGKYFAVVHAVKCMPIFAQATIRELPML